MPPSVSLRFVGPLERALFLRTFPMINDVPPADLAGLAENAREHTFRAGDVLSRRGQRTREFHIVVEGAIEASGGEFLEPTRIGPKEGTGFLTMLAGVEDGYDARALEDTITLSFDDDLFYEILEDHFSLAHLVIKRLAGRTLSFRRRIASGTYLAPEERIYHVPGRPLDFVERVMMLMRPGSVFGDASLEAIARLARTTIEVSIPAGVTLWKTGDRSDEIYVILRGTVACTTQWGAARFRAGPGYPLGNLERFSGDPRWFTAVTETPLVALRGETEPLLDILEDHFDLTLGLITAMARRVIDIQKETGPRAAPPAAVAAVAEAVAEVGASA